MIAGLRLNRPLLSPDCNESLIWMTDGCKIYRYEISRKSTQCVSSSVRTDGHMYDGDARCCSQSLYIKSNRKQQMYINWSRNSNAHMRPRLFCGTELWLLFVIVSYFINCVYVTTFPWRTIVLDFSQDTLFIDVKATLYVINTPSLNEKKM
jgi:hypothetical protein